MNDLQVTLRPLAERCVELADQRGRTPLVATQRSLSLAPQFYVALADELRSVAQRSLRLEVLVDLPRAVSLWRSGAAARQSRRIAAALGAERGEWVEVETRTVLSRAAGPRRPLVVGIGSADDPVPGWASIVRVTSHPVAVDDFQLIPSVA